MALDYVTTLSPEILQRATDELDEDDNRRAQNVQILREWLKKNPHLKSCPTDAKFLLKYLRGCKYSLEKCKKKIDITLTVRTLLPEFCSGWNPMLPEIQQALACGGSLPIPGFDQKGRKVVIIRGGAHDPEVMKFEAVQKASFMVMEILEDECEQMFITGLVIIFDMEGYGMGHFTQAPLPLMKKLQNSWEDANPLRPQSMHILRTPSFFNTFYALINTIMKEKMKQRMRVHGDDLESLHKEISKEILPKEYGGEGMSIEELTNYWKKKCESRSEWLMQRENMKTDESRRPGEPQTSETMFGMVGSFRKLNVD